MFFFLCLIFISGGGGFGGFATKNTSISLFFSVFTIIYFIFIDVVVFIFSEYFF